MRRRHGKFWRVVAGLTLILLLWSAWFVNTQGFSKKWRNYINREFRKHGFEVAIQRLTLDPFRGLVARNVQIFPYGDASRPTGEINEVALDVDYPRFLQGKDFLNAVDLRNSDIKIPVAGDGPPVIIQDLSARISMPDGEVVLRELQATILGVKITAEGRLATSGSVVAGPAAPHEPGRSKAPGTQKSPSQDPSADAKAAIAEWWPVLRTELMRYEVTRKPVKLKIGFSGHLDHLADLEVNAHLEGRDLLRSGEVIQHVEVLASYGEQKLTIKNLVLEAAPGQLKANGLLDLGAQTSGRFQVDGKFNFLPYLQPLLPQDSVLRDIRLQTPPEITISGSMRREEGVLVPELVGKLGSIDPIFRGEHFEHLEADFALNGPRWMVQGLKLVHASGQLTGAMRVLPGDLLAELESTLSPRAFAAVLGGAGVQHALSEIEFTRSPEVKLRMAGKALGTSNVVTRGTLNLPKFKYRGVWFESGSSQVLYQEGLTTLDKVVLERGEGSIQGRFRVTQDANLLFDDAQSTINASDLTKVLGPNLERILQPYRFRENPTVTVNGGVHLGPSGESDLKIGIASPKGMDAALFGKILPLDTASADVRYHDGVVEIPNLRAEAFGGDITLGLRVDVRHQRDVGGTVVVVGMDYGDLARLMADNDKLDGQLTAQTEFHMALGNTRTLSGKGTMKVESQNVFNMSFLGPLSGLLDNTIGFGASKARDFSMAFDIEEGRIQAESIQIISSGYALTGTGTYDIVDGSLDATMRANMRGGPGFLLYPVSKLLEFSASGTLREPQWRAKNFSRTPRDAANEGEEEPPRAIPIAPPVEEKEKEKERDKPRTPPRHRSNR